MGFSLLLFSLILFFIVIVAVFIGKQKSSDDIYEDLLIDSEKVFVSILTFLKKFLETDCFEPEKFY